jgi:hypothetical protein
VRWGSGLKIVDAAGHDRSDALGDVLGWPVPPGDGQKAGDVLVAVTITDESGRIAPDDAVSGDVVDDNGAAVRSRRSWLALIPGGAMVAAVAVAATGALLSASVPPPPQPGLHLDPTVANMTNNGPQGRGQGILAKPITVLQQPGPPLPLSWSITTIPLLFLVGFIVVAWWRMRPGSAREPLAV